MNIVVFRKPMYIYHSDASEHGIGGYSLTSGRAWHFELTENCHHHVSLNSLEFVTSFITIWVDTIESHIQPKPCLLSQTDSSSAAGWLRKSNFYPEDQNFQMMTARRLA